MTGARRSALVAATLASLSLLACKRSNPAAADAGARPSTTATSPGAASTEGALENATTGGEADAGVHQALPPDYVPPAPSVTYTASAGTEAPGGPSAPVDPFAGAIAATKAQAVGCFAPLPPGGYAVRLTVVVTPAGTATRASVDSASVTDESVLSCIRGLGESRQWPSSADGRTVSIDVRVTGK